MATTATSGAKPKLTLYFDVSSPFACIAFCVLRKSPVFHPDKVDVEYVPAFLGGILKATGNRPPIDIKNKVDWVHNERVMWAKRFNVPMSEQTPEGFPINTILALRVLHHLRTTPSKTHHLIPATAALYTHIWSPTLNSLQIQTRQGLAAVLLPVLGSEQAVRDAIDAAGSAEVKEGLVKQTEGCVQEGVFGMPWFVATNREGQRMGTWGCDHLGVVREFLGLDEESGEERGWKAML